MKKNKVRIIVGLVIIVFIVVGTYLYMTNSIQHIWRYSYANKRIQKSFNKLNTEEGIFANEIRKTAFFDAVEKGNITLSPSKNNQSRIIFPWEDVLGSKHLQIKETKVDLNITYEDNEDYYKLCNCTKEKFWMCFRSPEWTWENQCGREGYLLICSHCVKQVYFKCILMN